MFLTIELTDKTAERLNEAAEKKGIDARHYVRRLVLRDLCTVDDLPDILDGLSGLASEAKAVKAASKQLELESHISWADDEAMARNTPVEDR